MGAAPAQGSWDAVLAAIPVDARDRVAELANSAPEKSFEQVALEALQPCDGKSAASAALLDGGLLLTILSDPDALGVEQAVELARAAGRGDERIDCKLLNSLTAASRDWPRDVPLARIHRVLELLDAISDCRRLVIPLMKFVHVNDPKVRSKVVKLMARASQNTGWVESVLADSDPRVRCNLIEGLFLQLGRASERLLRRAARDSHHRVATTALLELAQLGDAGSRDELQRLSNDPRPEFQRAARWALAQLHESAPETEVASTDALPLATNEHG